jgi:hypothetical protein
MAQKIKFNLIETNPIILSKFLVNKKDRLYQFWKRNPKAMELDSQFLVEQKLDYIHNNPVQGKWMLPNSALEYPWSSIRFYEIGEWEIPFLTHYMEDV